MALRNLQPLVRDSLRSLINTPPPVPNIHNNPFAWNSFNNANTLASALLPLQNFLLSDPEIAPNVSYEVNDQGNNMELKVFTPGFAKEDLSIAQIGDRLEISGNVQKGDADLTKVNAEGGSTSFEKKSFVQTFALPTNFKKEELSAKYDNGILQIRFPKDQDPREQIVIE